MPQATPELRAKFPGSMEQALAELEAVGFTAKGGTIRPPRPGHELTEREGDAVDYLCDEWDFGWQP